MSTAPETTRESDDRPPTIARTIAGAGHIGVFLAHWAGGHTVSEEEITRRIVRRRAEAHAESVAEHGRQAKAAHKKATKLKRLAAECGGLVPAHQTALTTAEYDAQRHDAAISALGEFSAPVLDPGHVRHRRHRIAAVRCVILASPVGAVLASSWIWSGYVFLFSVLGGAGACLMRGDKPFDLNVRAVPAELIAATPMVLPIASATVAEPEDLPADPGEWREELRLYVERVVAGAYLAQRKSVHTDDLLHGLQDAGRYIGLTTKTFPDRLRAAGIPVKVVTVKGVRGLGVHHDDLAKALGHLPRFPEHLVRDIGHDDDQDAETGGGDAPLTGHSPARRRAG